MTNHIERTTSGSCWILLLYLLLSRILNVL